VTRPDQPPAAVRLTGWGFRHASRRAWAVRDVDLQVAPGERVLLTGASGAGKSTLLRALGGLLEPESGDATGELTVDGSAPDRRRQRVGMVFQDPDSQLVMTRAGDDVAFGLENTGTPPEFIWPAVDAALDAVGFTLGRDRATGALSGGQKQRLVLAGALAPRPGLLLLDEPTAQLDPEGAALVRTAVVRAVADRSATVLVVDHDVESWLPLVDRVVELLPGGGAVEHPAGWRPAPLRVPARSRHEPGEQLLAADAAGYTHRGSEAPALAATDAVLRAGRTLAVTGPNGTGKSTLALLLAGLRAPTTGRVVAGTALSAGLRHPDRPPSRWRAGELVMRIGTVFQQPEHQFLTGRVRDELSLGPLRSGVGAGQAHASGWRPSPTPIRSRSPAGSSGGSPWRRRWPPGPGCWCSTSPPSARTGRPGPSWSRCWPSSRTASGRCAWSPTTPPSSPRWPTTCSPSADR
jgi:energy-coupling factor transporter ATP-binding protein EcfA2